VNTSGRKSLLRAGRSGIVAALALALPDCSAPPPQLPLDSVQAIARSLSIIRSATPSKPQVLKILFYGQSISTPKWTDQAIAALRAKYPNVTFDYRNLALGGWGSALLERAAARDVEEVYPDLIVFHVYGDHRAYERIIQTFRSKTAADIIIQTDHVVIPVEPLCDVGFHLQWSPPKGCTGHFRFKQRSWEEFMSSVWEPTMARKYDLAMEPRRARWNSYLQEHHLQPSDLIDDAPHPNAEGWALMANLFTSWFEGLEDRAADFKPAPNQVRSFAPPKPGELAHYEFDGDRIELIAAGPLDNKLYLKVDGNAAHELDGCWQTSRVTRLPNVPDWPALKRVDVIPSYHQADAWKVRITHLDAPQEHFDFTVESARNGLEGSGKANEVFKSPSGRITIQPDDWNLAYAKSVSGKGIEEGQSFEWERRFICQDQPAVTTVNGEVQQRYVLATGLANGHHVVELTLAPNTPAISEVRAYRPPLVN
jgi:hypothetical protein